MIIWVEKVDQGHMDCLAQTLLFGDSYGLSSMVIQHLKLVVLDQSLDIIQNWLVLPIKLIINYHLSLLIVETFRSIFRAILLSFKVGAVISEYAEQSQFTISLTVLKMITKGIDYITIYWLLYDNPYKPIFKIDHSLIHYK